jgi:O-methyltransferase
MNELLNKILGFDNIKIDSSIINEEQIHNLVKLLLDTINNDIEGDVVEFGCYVGESSKYLMKTLSLSNSNKRLYVYDSFEGLPELSKWEENSGWRAGTLKSTEEILISNFKQNNLPIPIIHKDWFKNVPDYKIPEKISFAFLDGDFYDSIYNSLTKIFDKVSDGGYICFHDYQRHDLPGVKAAIQKVFEERGLEYSVFEICPQLGVYRKNAKIDTNIIPVEVQQKKIGGLTLVTGLWDIGRSNMEEGWSRSFDHYLSKFESLLKVDDNLIVFGDERLKSFVFERRSPINTQFVIRDVSWFINNEYYPKIQEIRKNPEWLGLSGWLGGSTQAKLELYNPLVMSKMFLLNDAKILDSFGSDYLFWIDAGLSNTVHPGYFTHDKVLEKLPKYISKFSFVCFPYEAENEIHGFEFKKINQYAGSKIKKVARGGFFGGPKDSIGEINNLYYSNLLSSLSEGYMGTEESIFSILCYKHSDIVNYFEIEGNGLMGTFFENLKNDNLIVKSENQVKSSNTLDINKTSIYVITFNSPNQFKTLIQSMLEYDKDFILKPKKILLDNSTDESTFGEYSSICSEYGFEHIKKNNLGICGGRQFIAEHFDSSEQDYMFFFEDDMFFYQHKGETCRNGFNRYVDNLYTKSLDIIKKENFDFLKLNYSEFFGDNGTQWSWYNVPQSAREKYWPNNKRLPEMGLDPNAPKTKYDNILSHKGVPYATGEVYYSNWPQIVSKTGNKKMFLDTKWAHPFEQTWMSHMYQLVKNEELYPGLLLMTPTEHDRFEHYDRELRKES